MDIMKLARSPSFIVMVREGEKKAVGGIQSTRSGS